MLSNLQKTLPLGTSSFEALRSQNEIYVDKTSLIYQLCQTRSKIFLARPRRFGKSLLASTFESLFKFGLRDFSGLAIEKLWSDKTYRVVRLDFSLIKDYSSAEDFSSQFLAQLAASFRSVGYSGPANLIELGLWLEAQPGNSLVVLIDEYDAPLTACLSDLQTFAAVQRQMSQLFLRLKSNDKCLRFFFMTGVTKLSNTGIFSAFNNLEDISLDSGYGMLLGYTESEILDNFSSYLAQAADAYGVSKLSLLEMMRSKYDGFCFDKKASTHVYCPWSVLNFLKKPREGFENYWYQSAGHPSVLMGYLHSHRLADPASYAEPKDISLDRLSGSQIYSNLQLEALLFQTGYLSIKEVDANGVATLGYPNEEVAVSMARLYADELLGGKVYKAPKGPSLSALLAAGSLGEVAARFNRVFNAIDYQRWPVKDEAVCRAFLQVLMMGADMVPDVEVHTAHGRSDLEVSAGRRRWVFEVKFARTEAEVPKLLTEGEAQMKARRYGETPDGENGAELMRAVIVFSSEKRQFAAWTLV